MATATPEQTQQQQSSEQQPNESSQSNEPQPRTLWPNGKKIQFIVLSGEYESGKTVFPLLIDPEGRTLVIDTEDSAEPYEDDDTLRFDRVDVPELMAAKFKTGDYKPIDVHNTINEVIKNIPPNKYKVISLDTGTEYEDGAVAYVAANPVLFGYTANQFAKSQALMWGAVKSYLKKQLSFWNTKCETFVVCMHMRDKWQGGAPTGKREAKGKETLSELASLSLELSRPVGKDGKKKEKPCAVVLKSRLMHTERDEKTGDVIPHPLLPPRLDEATPAMIRQYILNPPNYSKLKKGEKVELHEMTEEERLHLEAKIAEDQRAAKEAEVQAEQAKAVQAKYQNPQPANPEPVKHLAGAADTNTTNDTQAKKGDSSSSQANTPVNENDSAQHSGGSGSESNSSKASSPQDVPESQPASVSDDQDGTQSNLITNEQLASIIGWMKKFEWDGPKIKGLVKGNFGKESAKELTQVEAGKFLKALQARWDKEHPETPEHDPTKQAAEDRSAMDQWAEGQVPAEKK